MADDHLTEAACLLEQGASYRRRIGLKPVVTPGDPIFAGFKHGAFSLYFGDAPIYHFDLEGRWQRAFVDGTHYLEGARRGRACDRPRARGAEPRLEAQDAGGAPRRKISTIAVRSTALELIAGLDSGTLGRVEPASPKATPLATQDLRRFSASDRLVGLPPRGMLIANGIGRSIGPAALSAARVPECGRTASDPGGMHGSASRA